MGPPVIVLPDRDQIPARLRKKLDEYESRLDQRGKIDEYAKADTICKIFILESLLESGRVERAKTYETFCKKHGPDDLIYDLFHNAWFVVNDYCETGGIGLPEA